MVSRFAVAGFNYTFKLTHTHPVDTFARADHYHGQQEIVCEGMIRMVVMSGVKR